MTEMTGHRAMRTAAVFGASGGLGRALVDVLSARGTHVTAFTRGTASIPSANSTHQMDPADPDQLANAVEIFQGACPDLIFIATGILHADGIFPEKSLKNFTLNQFLHVMTVNAAVPILIAQAFLPLMKGHDEGVTLAALSARVGSISDNQLGGWHSYRASKAALNQLIRNLSIELRQRQKNAVAIGLHPGTVDTALSTPFQRNVPDGKLFTPDFSARKLIDVLTSRQPADSGKCFDYSGGEIAP